VCDTAAPNDLSRRPQANRSRATRTLGKSEESRLSHTLGSTQAVKISLEDALVLLGKYAEERTSVLAVVGSPSLSIARVTGPSPLLDPNNRRKGKALDAH
jgi:hypothetical protein